ncbi:MAG TPA: radical SAM protein [Candidatus Hydrogenedentes bacterium]|nr:radical SAM protein [Candidatus Hydrogenedentota bacterium]
MLSETIKILFLNPPHRLSISRRYRCSYYSPNSLLPPHDLLQLASCLRHWNHAIVSVVDAIAEKYTEEQTWTVIRQFTPDIIVAVTGLEFFGDDMACLERMRKQFPDIPCGIFGFYPTGFAEEILRNSSINFILRCEPEKTLSDYINALQKELPVTKIIGLAGHGDDGVLFVNGEQRLDDLDDLPFPDYSLVNLNHYDEALLGKRCAAILATRGCPFTCSYCASTYGHCTSAKSPVRVVEEMKHLIRSGANSIRFLDDTFTFDRSWVLAVCKEIIKQQVAVPWSCLSRVDTLDEEMLDWLRKAGCKRILVGIESYSARVLEHLNKCITPEMINPQLALIRKAGIQAVGFFMVGGPFEKEEDFQKTLKGALNAPLDLIIVGIMIPYAGTQFFEQHRDELEFSLFPYKFAYKDSNILKNAHKRYNRLYLRFYLRPSIICRHFLYLVRHPWYAISMLRGLLL